MLTADQWVALGICAAFLIAWVICAERDAQREFNERRDDP